MEALSSLALRRLDTAVEAFAPSPAAATTSGSAPGSASGSAPEPASTGGGPAVVFERLGKVYASAHGPLEALADIDLAIERGRIFGIIGRSGAGKSSLLRTVNRLERPTSGSVRVNGVDIAALDEDGLVALRRRVGMIFQHFNLLAAKTVAENIALPLRVAGARPAELAARVDELLALVGLADKKHVRPARLSGGQKQRVGIARALATRPDILLCDEATSALDPETTHAILALLKDINRRLGITIILITHEMSVIREIADEVLVLEQGRIAERGEVWRVFGAPRHAATRALLAPLEHGLPEDLRARLVGEPPAQGDLDHLLGLRFTGEDGLQPDLARIAAGLGGPVTLLHGGVDRIRGHAQGRLIVSLPASAALPAPSALAELTRGPAAIAHHIEVLGHVLHA